MSNTDLPLSGIPSIVDISARHEVSIEVHDCPLT